VVEKHISCVNMVLKECVNFSYMLRILLFWHCMLFAVDLRKLNYPIYSCFGNHLNMEKLGHS